MYEYKKNENVVVKSYLSKYTDYTAITIEVLGVPFMAAWTDINNVIQLDNMIETIINHFGSLSAEIYTEIMIAYRHAIDEVK